MVLNSEANNYRVLLRQLKAEYRAITGFDSDSNWNKFRKVLEKLGLISPKFSDRQNRDNLLFYSRLRLELPKTSVSLENSILFYLEQKKFTDSLNGRRMSGQDILHHLKTVGIRVSSPTRTNWFKSVGGYRAKAEYLPDEILKVLYRAAIYKASRKKVDESRTLGEEE